MAQARFSVSWDDYQKNICKGFGFLQQRGEFVDMTLAADGHYVKVHRMVISLLSPYIKDLICSIECSHPVVFLNNITYPTLCSILEYIYTGEVMVDKENLNDFIQAGKALHINGLDMILNNFNETKSGSTDQFRADVDNGTLINKDILKDFPTSKATRETSNKEDTNFETVILSEDADVTILDDSRQKSSVKVHETSKRKTNFLGSDTTLQYTMSNQGGLQMILNRYVYGMRYNNKNGTRRMWRCISYPRDIKCPAYVITEDGIVVERGCSHNHAFHDKLILRKIMDGIVYEAVSDAELQMAVKKTSRSSDD